MCATLNRRWLTNWNNWTTNWPRLNLSTGCPRSPLPPDCLPGCHTVSLPLCCHLRLCVFLSRASSCIFIGCCTLFSLSLPFPVPVPVSVPVSRHTHSPMTSFYVSIFSAQRSRSLSSLCGCSLQFRELSELIGRWFESAALTTPPAFSFSLKPSSLPPPPLDSLLAPFLFVVCR